MGRIKVKVINTTVGRYETDSITVILDGEQTEICFDKSLKVDKYVGKDIYLSNIDGIFVIEPIEVKK